ncbi:Argonaute family protein [Perilla frutescens var. hirtella]|uniref:Argonaute family protein n=1 Tax=Perilla frutescens var. hirtella TaxID=608512 RepID=A0AAD4JCQ8_PERFH|nr:Argonaute family protein [Perilla frutescens var. hirtella]
MDNRSKGDSSELLPLPPPPQKRVPMARPGLAKRGQNITLLVNHFKFRVSKTDGFFYQYSVAIKYEDGSPVEVKGFGRKILDRVQEIYAIELAHKKFAYDGEKTLFTIGPLPRTNLEFTVIFFNASIVIKLCYRHKL